MTDTAERTKICERAACAQPYHPRPGEHGQRWDRRRYCSAPCASAARINGDKAAQKKAAGETHPDWTPAVPVPAGEVWRPVGFRPVPDTRPRPPIRPRVRVVDADGGES